MKLLINIIVLVAIVFAYIASSSLYEQGQLVLAYSLILASITSLVFWIKSNELTAKFARA